MRSGSMDLKKNPWSDLYYLCNVGHTGCDLQASVLLSSFHVGNSNSYNKYM